MEEDLIKKYFDAKSSDQEKQDILTHLEDNPDALNESFQEAEWIDFLEEYENRKRKRNTYILKFSLIAASFFVIIFFGIRLVQKGEEPKNMQKILTVNNHLITHYINENSTIKKITLLDSSIVSLAPNSEITLTKAYNDKKRDIILEGEATFNVHKDKNRPFTVFSKDISTMALGTKFKVSINKSGTIDVQLFSGKIVVHALNKQKVKKENYYLLAGNSITYDINKQRFIHFSSINSEVKHTRDANTDLKLENEDILTKPILKNGNRIGIRFNGAKLSDVLDYLAENNHVRIIYPTQIIDHIHFIGIVKNNETIEKTLSNIASMNNLSLSQDTLSKTYILK